MHMIGHEYVCMNPAFPSVGCITDDGQVSFAILVVEEALLSIVAALGHMLGNSYDVEAARSGHCSGKFWALKVCHSIWHTNDAKFPALMSEIGSDPFSTPFRCLFLRAEISTQVENAFDSE